MTNPFQPGQVPGATPGGAAGGRRGAPSLPTPPKGWPVGSYPTYAEAQRAVDYLSVQQFPVQQVTIVGVDLMQVERVTGRLTWPKVLGGGVLVRGLAWTVHRIGAGLLQPQPVGCAADRFGCRGVLRLDHLCGSVRDGPWHKGFQLHDAVGGRPIRRTLRSAKCGEGSGSACTPGDLKPGREVEVPVSVAGAHAG